MIVPHRKHPWASTACYGNGCTYLYIDDDRTSQDICPWVFMACYGDSCTLITMSHPAGWFGHKKTCLLLPYKRLTLFSCLVSSSLSLKLLKLRVGARRVTSHTHAERHYWQWRLDVTQILSQGAPAASNDLPLTFRMPGCLIHSKTRTSVTKRTRHRHKRAWV
jgi:hypothetical protein